MVFKVYENNELVCIFDEDAPTHWVIIVDSSRVMQDCTLNVDPNLCQPLLLLVFYARNLVILAAKLTKDLDDAPLDLQFSFAGHQW